MLVTSDPTSSTVPTGTLDPVHFGIVLPAHDEEQLLPSALGALSRATGHVSDVPVVVGITIVLDACTDRSRDIVTAPALLRPPISSRTPTPQGACFRDAAYGFSGASPVRWSTSRVANASAVKVVLALLVVGNTLAPAT